MQILIDLIICNKCSNEKITKYVKPELIKGTWLCPDCGSSLAHVISGNNADEKEKIHN